MPPETVLANDPAARTETGEIKPANSITPEPKVEPTTEAKVEPKVEAKTEGDKSLLNTDGTKKEEPAKGAPEKYEEFKVPEGFTLDEKVATEASAIFKELGLPQAAAQKLVDFHVAKTQAAAESPYQTWKDTQDTWKAEIAADPEIGGKLDQVKARTSKLLDSLGDPKLASAFREAMDFTGAGNNPAFIRAFNKLAEKYTEGTHVPGGRPTNVSDPAGGTRTVASAMYPNLK